MSKLPADYTTEELRQHPLIQEWGRRVNAMRKTKGAGTGRPVKPVTCAKCGFPSPSSRAARTHKCEPNTIWCRDGSGRLMAISHD